MSNNEWHKSSYSGAGDNNCVELAVRVDRTGIRDSKVADGGALAVGPVAWSTFLAKVKRSH